MSKSLDLSSIEYAILALGDKNYDDFCAFGVRISNFLEKANAHKLSNNIYVDDLDKASLDKWDSFLIEIGGKYVDEINLFKKQKIKKINCLNPDSAAPPLFEIIFETKDNWEAGDICEIITKDGHKRDYSIATNSNEGVIKLYVRRLIKDDGTFGIGSGYLTSLNDSSQIEYKIRSHKPFHTPHNLGPSLLIAAGSGFAGIRPHLLKINDNLQPLWLIYGERNPITDFALCQEAEYILSYNKNSRIDFAFSKNDNEVKYVQDILRQNKFELFNFLKNNGNIILCGGLNMGLDVIKELEAIIGKEWLDNASEDGRFIKDLY